MKYTTEQKLIFMATIKRLVENNPPCWPNDMVHIHMREGMYKVISIHKNYFSIMLKRELTYLSWAQFRCLKGNGQSGEAIGKRLVNQLKRELL